MKTIFSTGAVHPRDRFDYWHSVACAALVDHESRPKSRLDFHAELRTGAIGRIGLVEFENAPMSISHTARQASRADTDALFVCRQMTGRLALEQCGRELILDPGDITLLDPRLAYSGEFWEQSRTLTLHVPRHLLECRFGSSRELVACPIKPLDVMGSLASACLEALPAHGCDEMDAALVALVEDQVLDVVAAALGNVLARNGQTSSARMSARARVRAAIKARLNDPALDSAAVAETAGISVRYANAVLADEGTSVACLIQKMRLERCRRALEDPAQSHRTVSEIAYGWGFSDMTHFGRRFKAAYQILPSEYRRLARESRLAAQSP